MPDIASACPLCRCAQAQIAGRVDRHGRPLTTLICSGCGLYRTDPLPTPAQLRDYYQHRYRLEYKGILTPKPHHVIRAARAARDRLAWLQPSLQGRGRWLDIGSGSGEFAYLLRRCGLDVTALEPNQGYAGYIRHVLHIPVIAGFLEDLDSTSGLFDGISLFHVLEHLPDPITALSRLRSFLTPNGLLAIEVPNSEFRHVHPAHRFHAAHLLHFNADNLAMAAAAAGFTPLACRPSSDGGILWALFAPSDPQPAHMLAEAVPRLRRIEDHRSALRYYASPTVWMRTLRRLGVLAGERLRAQFFPSPERFLSRIPLD